MAKKENVKEKKDKKENKQKTHFFKDMKAELKKVIWPSSKQLINNTLAVIAFTLIAALIVFVLDICFKNINKYGITALQEKIQTSYQASHPEENETTENSSTEDGTDENTNSSDGSNTVESEAETNNNNENSDSSSQE